MKKERKKNVLTNEKYFSGCSVLILYLFCIRSEVLRQSFESSTGNPANFPKEPRRIPEAICREPAGIFSLFSVCSPCFYDFFKKYFYQVGIMLGKDAFTVMHICNVNESHDYHAKNCQGENYNRSSRDEARPD